MIKSTLTFSAGALLRPSIRRILTKYKFDTMGFDWMEEKRWLDSVFILKGSNDVLVDFKLRLDRYIKELEK